MLGDVLPVMFETIAAARGSTVTYARGAVSVDVAMVPTDTRYEQQDESGAITAFKARAFIAKASDLVLDGSTVLPERFDTITSGGIEYIVRAPAGGEVFSWMDPAETLVRIQTLEDDGGD